MKCSLDNSPKVTRPALEQMVKLTRLCVEFLEREERIVRLRARERT